MTVTEEAVFEAISMNNKYYRYPDKEAIAAYIKEKQEMKGDVDMKEINIHLATLQKQGWVIKDFVRGGYRVA